ncbi:MAG: fimbrial protein [Rhizobacter sp.]|nr:fimbrial protein [Bacteriovorax sp.]
MTANANLALTGTITDSVSIAVTPSGNYNNLTLTTTAVDSVVASVAESSNSTAGYLILARSANASKLVHSTDATQTVGYTMKYAGGTAVTLTATDQTVKTQATGGVYSAVASAVSISYTGVTAASKRAGSYTDTITFTVQSQ